MPLISKIRHKIKESELHGFKYFKAISGMLDSLHKAGCQRDRAVNRKLHMDQYISLLLLYMYNLIRTSLRAVQQASELKKVQRKLGCPCSSLGSLSEAATFFDNALMQEIVTDLSDQLRPISSHAILDNLAGILTAVDGVYPERSRTGTGRRLFCIDLLSGLICVHPRFQSD